MEVNNLPILKVSRFDNKTNTPARLFGVSCLNLSPLKQDTVSFKGAVLKKSDFKGTDLAVIERYKPNIQQFKSKDDLQTFAENKINELKEKDFGGRREETKIQRKAMLKEWFDYVIKENDAYSNAQRLIILSAVTKELKPNNDTIPPVLNKGVLADTVTKLEEKLKANPKENFDFNKMYQNNLRASLMKDSSTGETMTGWVVIPSKKHDPENFEKNVEKLKTLSHNNWCTKSLNAEPYLSQGDFHVYLENGNPKLGVRFVGDEVAEIQGQRNNSKIPLKYFDTFMEYQKKCNMKLSYRAENEVQQVKSTKVELQKVKEKLGSALELKTIDDAIKIFDYFGIKAEKQDDKLIISTYRQPDENCQFDYDDLKIDENKLLQHVTEIKGDAYFRNSLATELTNLKSIGGGAFFHNSNIQRADALEYVGKNLVVDEKLKSLRSLTTIKGNADFLNTGDINLENLKVVGGDLEMHNSKIKKLDKLETIGQDADFAGSIVEELPNLKSIGRNAIFWPSKIRNLSKLETIGRDANFYKSEDVNLENLVSIGRYANFTNSKVTALPKLREIGGNCEFMESSISDLNNLEYLGGYSNFKGVKNLKGLPKLREVNGDFYIVYSKIANLDSLEKIVGGAEFSNSCVTNLPKLEVINGSADFGRSQIKNIEKLKEVCGDLRLGFCEIEHLYNLELIGGCLFCSNSELKSMKKLNSIQGDVYMEQNSKINIDDIENKVCGTVYK